MKINKQNLGGSQVRQTVIKQSQDPTKPPMMLGRIVSDAKSQLDADSIIEMSKSMKSTEPIS